MLENIVSSQRSTSLKPTGKHGLFSQRESISTASETPGSTINKSPANPIKLQRAIPLKRVVAFNEPENSIYNSRSNISVDQMVEKENSIVFPINFSVNPHENINESIDLILQPNNKPRRSLTKKTKKKSEKDITYTTATHIDLIKGLKKFRSLTMPYPFAPELPKPNLRNF